ncbi:MAG: hypothetical protein HQL53_04600 [Magnetococcales bacterium]|nr:hypothetical protein [Magnetococcales bacterium]
MTTQPDFSNLLDEMKKTSQLMEGLEDMAPSETPSTLSLPQSSSEKADVTLHPKSVTTGEKRPTDEKERQRVRNHTSTAPKGGQATTVKGAQMLLRKRGAMHPPANFLSNPTEGEGGLTSPRPRREGRPLPLQSVSPEASELASKPISVARRRTYQGVKESPFRQGQDDAGHFFMSSPDRSQFVTLIDQALGRTPKRRSSSKDEAEKRAAKEAEAQQGLKQEQKPERAVRKSLVSSRSPFGTTARKPATSSQDKTKEAAPPAIDAKPSKPSTTKPATAVAPTVMDKSETSETPETPEKSKIKATTMDHEIEQDAANEPQQTATPKVETLPPVESTVLESESIAHPFVKPEAELPPIQISVSPDKTPPPSEAAPLEVPDESFVQSEKAEPQEEQTHPFVTEEGASDEESNGMINIDQPQVALAGPSAEFWEIPVENFSEGVANILGDMVGGVVHVAQGLKNRLFKRS